MNDKKKALLMFFLLIILCVVWLLRSRKVVRPTAPTPPLILENEVTINVFDKLSIEDVFSLSEQVTINTEPELLVEEIPH